MESRGYFLINISNFLKIILDIIPNRVYNNNVRRGYREEPRKVKIEIKITVTINPSKKKSPAEPKPQPSNSQKTNIIINNK
jgi:hypothetical protein